MRRIIFVLIITIPVLISCNPRNSKLNETGGSVEHISVSDTITDSANTDGNLIPEDAVYQIEHAYLKYTSTIGVIREVWFSAYGKLQYEEAYRIENGTKRGTCSYVIDGYKYDMQIGSKEVVKTPFRPEPATEYEKLTAQQKEQYGVKKIGDESVLKHYCTVVSFEKPMPTTVWLYKGIPLKSVSSNRGDDLVIEAVQFDENPVDSTKFALPQGIRIIQI